VLIAADVNSVSAGQEENRSESVPHWTKLVANGALSFRLSWFAAMDVANCHADAHAALEAVVELGLLSKSAKATVEAVVDVLAFVVLPKLANRAVISRQLLAFAGVALTSSSNWLDCFADHAHHLLSRESVHNVVVGLLIVTDTAGRPLSTASGLDFAAALVVNATQYFTRRIVIRRLCVGTLLQAFEDVLPVSSNVVCFCLMVGEDVEAKFNRDKSLPQLLVSRNF